MLKADKKFHFTLDDSGHYKFDMTIQSRCSVVVDQRGNKMCWAANIVSAKAHYGASRLLIEVVDKHVAGCDPSEYGRLYYEQNACNKRKPDTSLGAIWHNEGFSSPTLKLRVNGSYASIMEPEISQNRPVQALVNQGFHAILIFGYRRTNLGTERFQVMDPQNSQGGLKWLYRNEIGGWHGFWFGLIHP